jgi:hypothetical protein
MEFDLLQEYREPLKFCPRNGVNIGSECFKKCFEGLFIGHPKNRPEGKLMFHKFSPVKGDVKKMTACDFGKTSIQTMYIHIPVTLLPTAHTGVGRIVEEQSRATENLQCCFHWRQQNLTA